MTSDHQFPALFADQPTISLPSDFLVRLTQSDIGKNVTSVALLVALLTRGDGEADKAMSERSFRQHPLVATAGELNGSPIPSDDWPTTALETAIGLGLVLRFIAQSEQADVAWLMLNTHRNLELVSRLVSGDQVPARSFWIDESPPRIALDRPSLFRLYEQNIGPLTPLIAQRLVKAGELYPMEWIETAIDDAVAYNRRSWRYIARILENRSAEGRTGRN
jgi:DnaD/phage-associated family protein